MVGETHRPHLNGVANVPSRGFPERMNSMTDQDASRARFRDLIAAHWAAVGNGDAKTADHRTEELNQLVRNVAQSGKTDMVLLPLLSETDAPTVRVAAAT